MAAVGLSRRAIWLALCMLRLGGVAYCDRAAVEPAAGPAGTAAGAEIGNGSGEFAGTARRNGYSRFRVCDDRFVTGAMAAHLPRLLEIAGASTTAAIAAAALVGPAQVAARLVEFGALRMVHPLVSARVAALLHPVGAVILGLLGPGAVTAFAVLHGAGNGLLTIAKGTVPLAIFGPVGYGLRSGILGAPARATQAASPLLFGLLMDYMGIGVIAVSAGLSLSACVALLLLKARPATAPAPA